MESKNLYTITATVRIKKGQGRTLKAGGAWIYDNEIDAITGEFQNGELVSVEDFDGFFLGQGFINTNSKLTVRMLSRKKGTVIDDAFIEMRVRNAWEYRKATVDTSSCRVIFGEADFLPGIVIDKFSDVLVVESLALGIDRLKPVIVDMLRKVLSEDGITIRGVYERSDAKVRLQEGMERYKGFIGEPFDTKVEIAENGVRYMVDVEDGQKTGFFLDQKYNRLAVQNLCRRILPDRVLDCFTHTGSFALNAGLAGSKEVLGVDASQLAVDQASENARLNGIGDRERLRKMTFYCFTNECLRDYILRYFGEYGSNYCGNCSNCLSQFETVDVTDISRILIGCVESCRQRYGTNVIIDTVRGANTAKIRNYRMDENPHYGELAKVPAYKLRQVMNHLMLNGYLAVTNDEYAIVKLTGKSKGILEEGEQVVMKMAREAEHPAKVAVASAGK